MLSDKTILEINKHTDPSSLLAVTVERLKRIKTPFNVVCIQSTGKIKKGQVVVVDSVHVSKRYSLIYQIGKKHYSYRYFQLAEN